MKKIFYLTFFNFLIINFSVFLYWNSAIAFSNMGIRPVYVSIVLHYEEDFVQSAPFFLKHREELLSLAEFLHDNGMKLNLQPDWAFLQAVNQFENDDMRLHTNGKNILQYLVEDLGHEVNPHAHEHEYNYADVAYMISNLGVDPGNIVGGFIVDPPEESKYDHFTQPISASHFDFTWQAQWLWGDATASHNNDTSAAGIWRPADAYHFYEHKDKAPLPCIGKYTSDLDGIYELIATSDKGEIEPNHMLTANIFIGQGKVSEIHDLLVSELDNLKAYKAEGKIVFALLSEMARIWTYKYDGKGYLYIRPNSQETVLAAPVSPMKSYSWGTSEVLPGKTLVSIKPAAGIMIQPRLIVGDCAGISQSVMYLYVPENDLAFDSTSFCSMECQDGIMTMTLGPVDFSSYPGLVFDVYFGYLNQSGIIYYNAYEVSM